MANPQVNSNEMAGSVSKNKIGTIFLIVGNFGVGKTSLVKGSGKQAGYFYNLQNGFKLFGGSRGADDIRGGKKLALEALKNEKGNIIVTGVFYQKQIDIIRYKINHNLNVIFLLTEKKTNRQRQEKRGGKFNERNWATMHNAINSLKKFCVKQNVNFIEIDNNREIEVVRSELFEYINKNSFGAK